MNNQSTPLTITQINNVPSLKPPLDWLDDDDKTSLPVLPWEIICKILYEFGGYQHPLAFSIKEAIKTVNKYNADFFIKESRRMFFFFRDVTPARWIFFKHVKTHVFFFQRRRNA